MKELIETTEITGRSSTQSKMYAVHQHVIFVQCGLQRDPGGFKR